MQQVMSLTLTAALAAGGGAYFAARPGHDLQPNTAQQLAAPAAIDEPQLVRPATVAKPAVEQNGKDATADIRRQLAALDAAQVQLASQLQQLVARLDAQQDPDLPLSDAVEFDQIDDYPQLVDLGTELSQGFSSETEDHSWSADAAFAIEDALLNEGLNGGELLSAECRATLCRIDVAFDDVRSRIQMEGFLPLLLPWGGESMISSDETLDPNHVVLYVAREGFDLNGVATY